MLEPIKALTTPEVDDDDQPQPLTVAGSMRDMPEVNPYAGRRPEELRPLQFPLHVYKETPGSYDRVLLRIPTLQPPFTFNKDPSRKEVLDRYQALLQLGLDSLNQPKNIPNRNMTRTERIAYKTELKLLDTLLTEVYQYTSPEEEVAFSIKPRLYQKIKDRLKKTEENVYRHNPSIDPNLLPEIPAWGPYGRDLQYWSPVDFEILG
ncbi:hypothetical protein EST38_g13655, partial [Candolleomyces aberdarensis]